MVDSISNSTASQNSPTEYKPANLFKRLAAMVYDFLLLTGLSFGYGAFALLARYFFFPSTVDTSAVSGFESPGIIFKLGWFFLLAVFFVFFWHRGGQTLGMRSWKIRVINKDGTNISITQGIIRCCIAPLSFGLAGIGYLWCLLDKEGQTIHDRISKSVTIQLDKEPPKKTRS
ncbi:MAG: RDD family protein [Cellvibrionaceae bacterium]